MVKEKKKKKFIGKLKNRFRLVILNDESFEERFSIRLTPLNVVGLLGLGFVVIISLTSIVIAFTPLKALITDYDYEGVRKQLVSLTYKVDSLETAVSMKDQYMENITNIINDNPVNKVEGTLQDSSVDYSKLSFEASREDSVLRAFVESEEEYNLAFASLQSEKEGKQAYHFFTPIKGTISNTFNPEEEHFGVDIVAPQDEAVKSTLDGIVIFSEWTAETGHVIHVQHPNNMVSCYKHNSVLLKKQGDFVKAGEVIAIIGNSGEYTTGPHLHFELWYKGLAINPEEYMVF